MRPPRRAGQSGALRRTCATAVVNYIGAGWANAGECHLEEDQTMSFLKIDKAGANQLASILQANAAARQSDLASLSSRLSPNVIWEGCTASAYEETYLKWWYAETELIHALGELGHFVIQISQNFDAVDQNGAGALG